MKVYQIQNKESGSVINTSPTLAEAQELVKAFYSEDSFNNEFVADFYEIVEFDTPTWFEVFETDADGTTRTVASFDTKAEALAFILTQPKGLALDEWALLPWALNPQQVNQS